MIRVEKLSKQFGSLRVLREVDVEIAPGRVTAIIGPNGAGKTTLMKSIVGLTRPDRGRILVDGERVGDDPTYRSRIGYMPQIARFPENLTAADVIAMLTDLRGPSARLDEELIGAFKLEPHLRKPLRVLSGGTRQKVNAVLAFLFDPDLLILDEPTSGLDPIASGILKDKIVETSRLGQTVVVASHVLSELDAICDDVIFLADGRVRFAGSTHDLKLATRQLDLERAIAQIMTQIMTEEAVA